MPASTIILAYQGLEPSDFGLQGSDLTPKSLNAPTQGSQVVAGGEEPEMENRSLNLLDLGPCLLDPLDEPSNLGRISVLGQDLNEGVRNPTSEVLEKHRPP